MSVAVSMPSPAARTRAAAAVYQPSWSSFGNLVACPPDLAALLHRAWDRMGVGDGHRRTVLGVRRTADEWASFALVVSAALRRMGLDGDGLAGRLLAFVPPAGKKASGAPA